MSRYDDMHKRTGWGAGEWGWLQVTVAIGCTITLLALLPGFLSKRDEANDAALKAESRVAMWRSWMAARDLDYKLCPPETTPSLMVLVISNESDKTPALKACYLIPVPPR